MRRLFALFVTALFALTSSTLAVAQDATPQASLLAGLGLPELTVTITAEGVSAPAEIAGGPMLLTVENQTGGFVVSSISQLPEGVTNEEYVSVLTSDAFPDWTAGIVVGGGIDLPPGMSGSIAIDLAEGQWMIGVSGDEPIENPIAEFEVTSAGAGVEIPADLDVELGAYVFDLPDQVAAGPQIWRVHNSHEVLHHAVLFKVERPFTIEEAQDGLMADLMGTPAADGFSLSTAQFLLATSAISQDQQLWIELDLEPGYYVALCFLPDPGSDTPHAIMGMIDTFEVTE